MPIYPFVCDGCGAEFEVMRKATAMKDPAPCPACNNDARRLFTGLALSGTTLSGEATAPGSDSRSPDGRTKPQGGWSHAGHSHGASTGSHSHGLWNR